MPETLRIQKSVQYLGTDYRRCSRDDVKGNPLVACSTRDKAVAELVKGKTKSEQAKVVGEELAKKAVAKGIENVVFDRGGYLYIGRVKSLADGAREGGLKF